MKLSAWFLFGMLLSQQRQRADALHDVVLESIGRLGVMNGRPVRGILNDQPGRVRSLFAEEPAEILVAGRILDKVKPAGQLRADNGFDSLRFCRLNKFDRAVQVAGVGQRNGRQLVAHGPLNNGFHRKR